MRAPCPITPAATLQPGGLSGNSLLESTPDANTTDPFIQEEAAALDYDPTLIFNFLHTQIGYNSYIGSMRGRGHALDERGQRVDVASLGVALMRASGIPAQYVQGTLSQSQAQQLILSMFPASYQTAGFLPAGTQTSDPANDSQLLRRPRAITGSSSTPAAGCRTPTRSCPGRRSDRRSRLRPAPLPQSRRPEQTTESSSWRRSITPPTPLVRPSPLDRHDGARPAFDDVALVGQSVSVGNLVTPPPPVRPS